MLLSEEVGAHIEFKVEEFGGVRNHFLISLCGNTYFQSYNSIIGMINSKGRIFLDRATWDYSRTTGKYRNKWLGEGKRETEKKIKSGKYILTDLNKE